jgi:hypothetical protein
MDYCPHGMLFVDYCTVCTPSQDNQRPDVFDLDRRNKERSKSADNCACECGRSHHNYVISSTVRTSNGNILLGYATQACQSRHAPTRQKLAAQ